MTPKQRLAAALAHEEPDRCPLDLWITPEVEAALMHERGIRDPFELRVAMGHDLLMKIVGQVASFYMSDQAQYVDAWGILWRRVDFPEVQGSYTEMVGHPLAGEDGLLASYRPPGRTHAIVGGVLGSAFEGPWYLRGMDQFLADMLLNKDYAHALADLVADWNLVAGLKLVELGCDLILAADDLVETGVDVLNPVQLLAMDPERLKKRYGRHLSFWVAVDDQRVLPLGTPENAEEEVRLRLRQLAPGFILCSSHNVQPGMPMANIRAFYRAAERYSAYPMAV
jgi:uroporphyrinogen decarboxylase